MIPRGLSYDDAMRQFRWPTPAHFNIGRAVCERHAPDTLAMIVRECRWLRAQLGTFGQLLAASSRLANALDDPRHRQGRSRCGFSSARAQN